MAFGVDLLTVSEAAVQLRISTSLTYELIRQERLPHVHLGRRVLVPAAALHDWLLTGAIRSIEFTDAPFASRLPSKKADGVSWG